MKQEEKLRLARQLRQSSTVAQSYTRFTHKNGVKTHIIAGSYVEFAERINNRDEFEVSNADKFLKAPTQIN